MVLFQERWICRWEITDPYRVTARVPRCAFHPWWLLFAYTGSLCFRLTLAGFENTTMYF